MKIKMRYIFPAITFLGICTLIEWNLNSVIAIVNGLGGGVLLAWIISDWSDKDGRK